MCISTKRDGYSPSLIVIHQSATSSPFSSRSISIVSPADRLPPIILLAAIVSTLEKGVVEIGTSQGKQQIPISNGFVEVHKNNVSICAEL